MKENIPVSVEVRCVTKSNDADSYKGISHIGGPNGDGTSWKMSVKEAIENIKADKYAFYINRDGNKSDLILVSGPDGSEYLRTSGDKGDHDNLSSLSSCEHS